MQDEQQMSEEHIENSKCIRRRKKNLYNSILQQMEFYFSDANIRKDRFIGQLINDDPYINLSVFLKFNKISSLTNKIEDIATALEKSKILKLTDDKLKVCRTTPIKQKENEDECTIYVERLPEDTTHDWLKEIFIKFGAVDYISLPKYKHNKRHKGFAFIEFADAETARKSVEYFESIGCKLPTQMPPNQLASIITFDTENRKSNHDEDHVMKEPHIEINEDSSQVDEINTIDNITDKSLKKKKRKHSVETEETEIKKIKKDDFDKDNENNKTDDADYNNIKDKEDKVTEENIAIEEIKRKRKRKKNKRNNCDFTQMGLQVLSKREWKQLRNKYLNMQRIKMKTLKEHLYRNHYDKHNLDNDCETAKGMSCTTEPKFKFTQGCIIKFLIPDTYTDIKKLKNDIRTQSGVEFIDVYPGKEVGFIRFSDNVSSTAFVNSTFSSTKEILTGQEESDYWEKILRDRETKLSKVSLKKIRGREKLLKKAEHELGKHIRFDSM